MTGDLDARVLDGRYVVGALAGTGAMGSVYAGHDRRLDRAVAIKVLHPAVAEQPHARRRFETEARAAARIVHPHVVVVHDSGEHDGAPYLVMELLPGRTLADEINAGPMPIDQTARRAAQIADALAAAHRIGVLHRDVKPGNVLLTPTGDVKVADFGIAKLTEDLDATMTSELAATPAYLAPERARGRDADERTDVYALGVVLYEMLTGVRPFVGRAPLEVLLAIEAADVVPILVLRPETPAWLASLAASAMAPNPDRRIQSARELADALVDGGVAPRTLREPAVEPDADPATVAARGAGSREASGAWGLAAPDPAGTTVSDLAPTMVQPTMVQPAMATAAATTAAATTAAGESRAPASRRGERVPARGPSPSPSPSPGPRSRRTRAALVALALVIVVVSAVVLARVVDGTPDGSEPSADATPTTIAPSVAPGPAAPLPPALEDALVRLDESVSR